jgi:hypothetical protein
MLFEVRSIGISCAVVFFFGIGFIGWASGLSPDTCCNRALAGAVLAYMAAATGVRVINAILTSAMIRDHMKKKEQNSGSTNQKYF